MAGGDDDDNLAPAPGDEQRVNVQVTDGAPSERELPDLSTSYLDGKLQPWEVTWRDRFEGLKSNGYLLRPRFRPGWQPSWLQTGLTGSDRLRAEDFLVHMITNVIDATCIKDDTVVMIKRLRPNVNDE